MRTAPALRCALAALAVAALPAAGAAQGVTAGVSAGLSLASLAGEEETDLLESRTGFNAGAFLDFPLGEILGVTMGLYYVQKGAREDDADLDLDIDYIEVPALFRVVALGGDASVGINLFVGPTLAFQIKCETSVEGFQTLDCDQDDLPTKSFDLGLGVGAGLTFPMTEAMALVATALYDIGLTSIDDSGEDLDLKNEAILLNVGLALSLGR